MERLVKLRTGYRSSFTRSYNKFMLCNDNPASTTTERKSLAANVDTCWTQLLEIQEKVMDVTDDNDIMEQIESHEEYQSCNNRVQVIMQAISAADCASSLASSAGNVRSQARLPKLNLPKFDGDYLKFMEFWQMFHCTVHDNKSISDIEKFTYLKSLLVTPASDVIKGLALSSENYEKALELLQNRFGSKNRLVKAHVKEILAIEPIKTQKYSNLRKMVDKFEVHVRGLDTLGMAQDTYGCFLMQIILSRLPTSAKLAWARKDADDSLEIEDLMTFLRNEASALEVTEDDDPGRTFHSSQSQNYRFSPRGGMRTDNHFNRDNGNNFRRNNINSHQTHSNSYSGYSGRRTYSSSPPKRNVIGDSDNKHTRKCFLCSGEHGLAKCEQFIAMDVPKRYDYVKSLRLCFNCYGRHMLPACKLPTQCRTCEAKHHHLLHFEKKAALTCSSQNSKTLMPTLELKIRNESEVITVYALLDTGSEVSLIDGCLSESLNCGVVPMDMPLQINGIGGLLKIASPEKYMVTIDSCEGEVVLPLIKVPKLHLRLPVLTNAPDLNSHYTHLEDIKILIGVDCLSKVLSGESQRMETICGPTLFGNVTSLSLCVENHCIEDADQKMDHVLKRLWQLELEFDESDEKSTESEAYKHFQANIHRGKSGRYCVGWPITWNQNFETHRDQSLARFMGLKRRLLSDKSLRSEYGKILKDYLNLGIIEKLSDELKTESMVRYLPHHPVSKKEKVRIVFDASSKDRNGLSLNDLMVNGPNLNPDIPALLIRFREGIVGMIADIEKAFLQLDLLDKQQDLTRFFWMSDGDDSLEVYRMKRVLFGAKASPFLLSATLKHHILSMKQLFPQTVQAILNNFYVDDLVVSCQTHDAAVEIVNESFEILSEMNCNLRNWFSNDSDIMKQLNTANSENTVKVLGLKWCIESDTLTPETPDPDEMVSFTKRELLSFIAKVWDPVGILAPVTLSGRILMRKLWEAKISWDEVIPEDVLNDVRIFLDYLLKIRSLSVPRHIGLRENCEIHLHGFGDASETAIGAVIFLAVATDSSTKMHFVIARSKLAPSKRVTIPRLELLASELTAKLLDYTLTSLKTPVESVTCWSDSRVALGWIRGDINRWKQFVGNRVKSITSRVEASNWKFIEGCNNPADIVSRGILDNSNFDLEPWINGERLGGILRSYEPLETKGEDVEVSKEERQIKSCSVSLSREDIFKCDNYSSLKKVLRITAWILRVALKIHNVDVNSGPIRIEEMRKAKLYWIKQTQSMYQYSESWEKLTPLAPFVDENQMVRSNRRLECASLTYDEKYPLLIDGSHPFTKLLILDVHLALGHSSISRTLSEIRNLYWIPRARTIVRSLIYSCMECRKKHLKAEPCPTIDLPSFRVDESSRKPFDSIGLDFTGPIAFEEKTGQKVYILLFTCARIRAIHLEVTKGIDAKSCMNAIKCFIFRRGIPSHIISDNAKTFQKVSIMTENEYGTVWSFITPCSPWRGGFYERLNRSIKEPLRHFLKKQFCEISHVQAVVCQIEAIVNSRPLMQTTDDDSQIVLTPAHFLIGGSLLKVPTGSTDSVITVDLPKLWKGRNDEMKAFWMIWRQRYLRELRIKAKSNLSSTISVNDLVLVNNEKERNSWPLAIVTRTIPSQDGIIRTVEIKMNGRNYLRPIQRIYLLEKSET